MKHIKPLAVGLTLAVLAGAAFADDSETEGPAEGLKTLPGTWAGDYFCTGSGQHGMTLLVYPLAEPDDGVEAYSVTATLWFYPLMSNPAAPKGAFHMEGTMSGDGELDLMPTEWIEKPSNYGAASIEGVFDYFDDEIRGLPAGRGAEATGCKALHLTRLATAE